MKAVAVKCPNCNAALSVAETAAVAMCKYCGESCRIQQRTMFLQRPVAPQVTPAQFANEVRTNQLRVAQTAPRYTWLYVMIGLVVTLGVGASSFLMSRQASSNAIATSEATTGGTVEPKRPAWRWDGGSVYFGDVNGDSKADLVGYVRNTDGESAVAGYSLDDGSLLWVSASLGKSNDLETWKLEVFAGHAVLPLKSGELVGVALGGSGIAWRISLGEKFSKACASGDPSLALIETSDRKRWLLEVRTGNVSEAPATMGKAPACRALVDSDTVQVALPVEDTWAGMRELRNSALRVEAKVVLANGDVIVVGTRSPGTAVPTVARAKPEGKNYEIIWKVETPINDPLTADFDDAVAVVGDVVITPLIDKERNVSLIALDIADGTRRWITELSLPVFRALAARESKAYLSALHSVAAVDIATGKTLWITAK